MHWGRQFSSADGGSKEVMWQVAALKPIDLKNYNPIADCSKEDIGHAQVIVVT
jgi:hypothetical protein